MKEISTVNMNSKDKKMLVGNVLGSFGNENIRGQHIAYFEKRLIEENEDTQKDVTLAPNYYAWLCLMSEHLFWMMRNFCFRQNAFSHDNLVLMYNELITRFCDTCLSLGTFSEKQLQNLFEIAIRLLEIRHAIVHKGFPNLLPIVFENRLVRNKPSKIKGGSKERFTEESTRGSIEWFSNPQNFVEIRNEFYVLIKAMGSGPGFSIGF